MAQKYKNRGAILTATVKETIKEKDEEAMAEK
jgi:hypothetical protein